jgi:hypothetical protein
MATASSSGSLLKLNLDDREDLMGQLPLSLKCASGATFEVRSLR